ncbi:MAG: hypothetical protein KDC37_01370, partial [Flavobacteriales bacterium]|nr:hypothetical protein [Flavobacteriales bacterium]
MTFNPTLFTVRPLMKAVTTAIVMLSFSIVSNAQLAVFATSDTICLGDTTRLYGTGATTYQWHDTTGNAAVSPLTGDTVHVFPTVTSVFRLIGDSGTMNADTVYITIVVNTPPTISLQRNKDTLCSGSELIMWGTGANSYVWKYGTTTSSVDTLKVSPTITTKYYLQGITDACTSATDSFSVFIRALPIVNYTLEIGGFTPNVFLVCTNKDFTLNATGALSYTWSGPVTPTTGASVTGNISVAQPIVVTGTDAYGCQGVRSRNFGVNSDKKPIDIAWKGDSVFCRGDSTLVEVSGGNEDLLWSPMTGLSYTSSNRVTAKPIVTTTYGITGIYFGCLNTSSLTVTINQPPSIAVQQSSNGNPLCMDEPDTLTIVSPGILFDWGFGVLSSEKVKTVLPGKTTTFNITSYDAIGCGNTIPVTVNVNPNCGAPLHTQGPAIPSDLRIWAVSDKLLKIEANLHSSALVSLRVLNMLGTEVAQATAVGEQGRFTHALPLRHLTSGVYVVQVRQGND